ncbi:MAG: gluconokinase [Burkholderiales bacterium]|nr:gluconokinase [Burkholderiales bacterium]
MGVSGCGKSSLADAVAAALGWRAIEGDDFHGPRNKALMHAGIALTDADRAGWLDALGAELAASREGGVVLSCSALKRSYRDRLRGAHAGLRFAFLEIAEAAALARVAARAAGHFFPAALVRNQFETLEPPTAEAGVLRLDALLPPSALLDATLAWLARPFDRQTHEVTP